MSGAGEVPGADREFYSKFANFSVPFLDAPKTNFCVFSKKICLLKNYRGGGYKHHFLTNIFGSGAYRLLIDHPYRPFI